MKWLSEKQAEGVLQDDVEALGAATAGDGRKPGIGYLIFWLTVFGLVAGSMFGFAEHALAQEDDSKVAAGLKVWKGGGCASCHATFGQGGGGSLIPEGANLRETELDQAGIVRTVSRGRGDMPSFEERLTPEEIQAVADYLIARVVGRGPVSLDDCEYYRGQGHVRCNRYR